MKIDITNQVLPILQKQTCIWLSELISPSGLTQRQISSSLKRLESMVDHLDGTEQKQAELIFFQQTSLLFASKQSKQDWIEWFGDWFFFHQQITFPTLFL